MSAPDLRIDYRASPIDELYEWKWQIVDRDTHKKYAQENYHKWHTGRFMPCFASRIRRRIKDIRVQRIQDISEEDTEAEGCIAHRRHIVSGVGIDPSIGAFVHCSARRTFKELWNSIHKRDGMGWDYNPWVFALTLEDVK